MSSPPSERHAMATKRLQYHVNGADAVTVTKNVPLADGHSLVDIYRPNDAGTEPLGWVLFVNGLSDVGARRILGCAIKDMAAYDCWGRAVAARGIVGITHATDADPWTDVQHVWSALQSSGEALGLGLGRGAIWACSAHVPGALGLLIDPATPPIAAVLCYGYMLDLAGEEAVIRAQQTWRFANPASGRTVADLARVPLLLIRAGRDATPGVNATIDAFVKEALALNAPLTAANYADAGHGFDLDGPRPASSDVVEQVLGFLTMHTSR